MATFSKAKLSQSTDGRGIKVANTVSPGTSLHTAVAGSVDFHEIWIYAFNSDTASVDVTLEFGGETSPDDVIKQSIPSQSGLYLIVPGLPLQGGVVVKAFASKANVVTIHGFVNSIDQ